MDCLCKKLAGGDVELSASCIGSLWLFASLKPSEVEALALAAQRRRLPVGEVIFRQGSPASQMFLIKGGRVKLSKVTEKGDEITLDIRKAGDFLGENMLNDDVAFPVTATCLMDTVICGFSKKSFEKLIMAHPNIGLQVIRNLSKRIDWLTSRVGSMSHSNLEERLYRVLANVAREHGRQGRQGLELPFPFTHEDLAFLVGAHRVSITRALKGLRHAGLVLQEGRTLIVAPEERA
jgi:CRP/FNR family transcriptional regulator